MHQPGEVNVPMNNVRGKTVTQMNVVPDIDQDKCSAFLIFKDSFQDIILKTDIMNKLGGY